VPTIRYTPFNSILTASLPPQREAEAEQAAVLRSTLMDAAGRTLAEHAHTVPHPFPH
jgi:hypothetical protein